MDSQGDIPRSQRRFSSTARLAALGAAVLVLIGVVAAASRAHHTPGGRAGVHSPPAGVGNYVFTIFAIVAVGGLLGLVLFVASARDPRRVRTSSNAGTLRALFMILLVSSLILLVTRVHDFRGDGVAPAAPRNGAVGALQDMQARAGGEPSPTIEWWPVLIAGTALLAGVVVVGLRAIRRARVALVDEFVLEQQFETLLDDTLADLYAERDPRAAIIAAYARVERLFATSGHPRHDAEAPVEYLERVLPQVRASGPALRRLTALFEWAKFSAHDVDRDMRDEAIDALAQVRDDLRLSRVDAA